MTTTTPTQPSLPGPPRPGFLAAPTVRAPASVPAQVAAYLVCVLAIGLASAQAHNLLAFLVCAGGLTVGVVVGVSVDVSRVFTSIAGWVWGLVATVALLILIGNLTAGEQTANRALPMLSAVAAGLAITGLDWSLVTRLRAAVVLSGLFVVPLIGAKEAWAFPAALAWLVGVIVTMWLLERDARLVVPTPQPLTPQAAPDDALDGADLARAIGIALAIGLAVAFLVGRPSCSADPPKPKMPSSGFGNSASGSGSGQSSSASSGGSGLANADGTTRYQMGADGQEQQLELDGSGRPTVLGNDGQRYTIEQEGDSQVIRDPQDRVVGRISPGGVVALDSSRHEQAFTRDADGRLSFEGRDGQRYTLTFDGNEDREGVLRDSAGNEVGRGGVNSDHLYLHDPNGNVVVPDADGNGSIIIPNAGFRKVVPTPPAGQVTTHNPDGSTVVRDADGSTRSYDTDAEGNPRVQVAPVGGEPTRTYVLRHDASGQTITEYDANGRQGRTYRYDPDGTFASPTTLSPAGSSSASSATASSSPESSKSSTSSVPWALILGLAALVVAVVAAAWALTRDQGPAAERSWAERMSDRLDREGAAHGRGRRRYETVVDYTRTLGDTLLPDPRVAGVGVVLSNALFSTADPPPETRAWAERVVDEVVEQNPPPRWTDRFRRSKDDPGSVDV